VIVKAGETDMAKATHDGTYTNANGDRFVIRAGDPMPDGAVMDAADEPVEEERAKPKAPQNRSKGAAPENRSA
jgi:hypothetical protein